MNAQAASSIVLLGGTSDIGQAIVCEMLKEKPAPVVLVMRGGVQRGETACARMLEAGAATVRVVELDVTDEQRHQPAVADAFSGDVGTVIIAFGVLGDAEEAWTNAALARELFTINATAAVSIGVLVAASLRAQKQRGGSIGKIIVLSSIAEERVRRANFVYGASKAGMDGFFRGLAQALRPDGIEVFIVRPGFVHSTMTAGKHSALAIGPQMVARAVVSALRKHQHVVRVPRIFTPLMAVYRVLPDSVVERLPW